MFKTVIVIIFAILAVVLAGIGAWWLREFRQSARETLAFWEWYYGPDC